MPERPQAMQRLDGLLGAATIAHEAIFDMRRELVTKDRAKAEQASLVEESARIVTAELPNLSARTRELFRSWGEQSLLEAERAAKTLKELEAEIKRIEPSIQALLDRQREIASRLRSMLET